MKIYIASDHAGFPLKEELREHLKTGGHEVLDLGVFDLVNKVDYRTWHVKWGEGSKIPAVAGFSFAEPNWCGDCGEQVERIRAANVHDVTARARLHNDANILTLGQRTMSSKPRRKWWILFKDRV